MSLRDLFNEALRHVNLRKYNKYCVKCKEILTLDCFSYRYDKSGDGFQTYCKWCQKSSNRKNRGTDCSSSWGKKKPKHVDAPMWPRKVISVTRDGLSTHFPPEIQRHLKDHYELDVRPSSVRSESDFVDVTTESDDEKDSVVVTSDALGRCALPGTQVCVDCGQVQPQIMFEHESLVVFRCCLDCRTVGKCKDCGKIATLSQLDVSVSKKGRTLYFCDKCME